MTLAIIIDTPNISCKGNATEPTSCATGTNFAQVCILCKVRKTSEHANSSKVDVCQSS